MDKNTTDRWHQYYSILGEFVVDFENIVYTIREDCTFLLESKGLSDSRLGEIVFGQRYMTADPLLSCYVTMVNHIIRGTTDNEKISKRLDSFKNKFVEMIKSRNNIVHSTHFLVESINLIGPPKNETEFKAYKPSPDKMGYNIKKTPRTEIIELTEKLKALKVEFEELVEDLHKHLITNGLRTG